MTDIVKLYNPANSASLTPEQITGLQKLTSAELKELALAYPNMTMQRAYLLIIDGSKPAEKQLPTLSSFENLWNLREKNGLKNFVAFNFKGTYKSMPAMNNVKVKRQEILDLSETELMSLPGFKVKNAATNDQVKVSEPQTVKVTKVHKELVSEPATAEAKPASKEAGKPKAKKSKSK